MDSFKAYEDFSSFITRPLTDLVNDDKKDLNCFQNILRKYTENIIGEIRNNCQAHNNPRDTEIYLFTITAKLNGLRDQLFLYPGDLIHKLNYDNPIEISFVPAIEATFIRLLGILKRIPWKLPKKELMSAEKGKSVVEPKYYSLKAVDEITDEDLTEVLNTLKSYKFKSIDPETTDAHFIACFSGNRVEFKVKWLRINVLHYFITSLAYNDLLESPINRIWELSSHCFVDKYGHDLTGKQLGKTYDTKSDRVIKVITGIITALRVKTRK